MKKTLEEISIIKGEYGGGFSAVDYFQNAPRYIRITDITEDGQLNEEIKAPSGNSKEWERYTLHEGDLLFARSGATVGKTFLYTESYGNCIFAGYLIRFKLNKKLAFPKYVYYYTKSSEYYNWIKKKQNVVAQPNINAKQYGLELEVPLLPLPIQEKIAAILDAADEYRLKTKMMIEKYDQLAKSLFLEMFGDPVTNPKGLKVVKLKDVTTRITDGVHAKPDYTDSGVPFISVKDITTGTLKFDNCKFISKNDHNKFTKRCSPQYLDILYTKVGATYGRPAIIDSKNEFSIYVSVALIKPKHSLINPYFLKDALGNPAVKRQADKSIKGIGVPDLHLNMIKEFLIPLPDFALQKLFADRIEVIEQQKALAQASLQKAEELFNSLLQRAFNGELIHEKQSLYI